MELLPGCWDVGHSVFCLRFHSFVIAPKVGGGESTSLTPRPGEQESLKYIGVVEAR
jgi:hypothetical protein